MIALVGAALAGRYAMDHNHPDLRWHTIRTQHLDIHYPVSRRRPDHPRWLSGEGTAKRLAVIGDDTWTRLATELGTFPNERVHVVVLEHEDDLVGFTLPAQDWVVFSGNPGPELARMRGRIEWVDDLLAHELAHVLTLKRSSWLAESAGSFGVELGGLAEDGVNQLGAKVDLLDNDPYWWSEGAAEYWSERIGVNTWTPSREMTLRASLLDGRLLDGVAWNHSALLDGWYEPERAYQQGYAFHRWFAATYGDGAWREVNRRASQRFRPVWTDVFEPVVGQRIDWLKARFEEDERARVDDEVARLRALGRVEGEELALWSLGWQPEDLRASDRWALRAEADRRRERERTGTHNLHAAYSDDGQWFARHRSGWLEVRAVDEAMWTVFAGRVPDWDLTRAQRDRDSRMSLWLPARYGSDLDFVPGADALVMVGWEDEGRKRVRPLSYRWTRLYRVDLTPRTIRVRHRGGKAELETLADPQGRDRRRMTPIPGTLRAMDPSVSPDGQWLAYTRYGDGTTNLWISRIDGSERRALTRFDDGTWIQGTDWSPDGRRIVFAMHRDHQQNLWTAEVDTGALTALTADRWEELDPHWAPDGSVWFSADVDGVFDVFRRDPSGSVHRMTRSATGMQSPSLTPSGNLLATRYTAFGFKTVGVPRAELLWDDATDRFGAPGEPDERHARPESPAATPYRWSRAVTGTALGPMLRLDRGVDGAVIPRVGAWFRLRDAVEVNTLDGQAWIGADAYATARWTWHRLWPEISVGGSHWVGRVPQDTARRQVSTVALGIELPWTPDLSFDVGLLGFRVLREGDHGFDPVHRSRVVTAGLTTGDLGGLLRSNTRTGAAHRVVLSRGDSVADTAYAYHRAEWEAHAVLDAPSGASAGHRLVLDGALGATDRAVAIDDALRAGGDHPYALRPGIVQGTVGLPGYAPFAFATDSLAVGGAAWRIPLARGMRAPVGPLVLDEVFAQLGGHVGATAGAAGPETLGDALAQLRVRAVLLDARWDSVLTFAWGAPTVTQPGGPRFVFGLGTGF